MSDIATGKDADFSEERLIERYNADLANSLGNLLNRTLEHGGSISRLELIAVVKAQSRCSGSSDYQST